MAGPRPLPYFLPELFLPPAAFLSSFCSRASYGVLLRSGRNRLPDTARMTGAPVRYVACHPGALFHQDAHSPSRLVAD